MGRITIDTTQDHPAALVDEAIERYITWRADSGTVEACYRRWRGASVSQRGMVFAIYTAALDDEERSAIQYAGALDRLTQHLWPESR